MQHNIYNLFQTFQPFDIFNSKLKRKQSTQSLISWIIWIQTFVSKLDTNQKTFGWLWDVIYLDAFYMNIEIPRVLFK